MAYTKIALFLALSCSPASIVYAMYDPDMLELKQHAMLSRKIVTTPKAQTSKKATTNKKSRNCIAFLECLFAPYQYGAANQYGSPELYWAMARR